jgi:hypothetical protein
MGIEQTISKIYETDDIELINFWVTNCVSNSTGKRKWNRLCYERRMSDFVTFSDESFAMLIIENNAEKWREKLLHPNLKKKELPKSRYTEGEEGNRWSLNGMHRFIDLFQQQRKKRNGENSDQRKKRLKIEDEILKRYKGIRDGMSRMNKRKRFEEENEETQLLHRQKTKSLESCLLAMSNGEEIN